MSSIPDPQEQSGPQEQAMRLREAKVRAYQTYIIFRDGRFANHGLKLLTFLGIAIPLLVGGIISSVFVSTKPPYILLLVAGLASTCQAITSVWAIVDRWEEKAHLIVKTTKDFSDICTQLELLQPDQHGVYDESKLCYLESMSYGGRYADNLVGVRQRVRDLARKKAEKHYPRD